MLGSILDARHYCNRDIKTAAVAAVLGANIGTTGTIWLAGLLVSDGMPRGDTLRIALVHTGVNLLMAISLLPFVHHIAKYVGRVGQ